MPSSNRKPVVSADAPTKARILLVDDNDLIRESLGLVLVRNGYEVVTAANVDEALKVIAAQAFDVLLSDLHMPRADDGFIVVNAMRRSHPNAIAIVLSGYPEMKEAATAILLQADEIAVKPMAADSLLETIRTRLRQGKTTVRPAESVATILQQEAQATIQDWLQRVALEPHVLIVPLNDSIRCEHLPQLFRDLVHRLRFPLPLGTRALISAAAAQHGLLRRRQGYSAAMLVEESRMLQVSIFQTLQNNLHRVDFSLLLVDVMSIADEVDSQLAQAMASYVSESQAPAPARFVASGGLMVRS
jgi:CheY-like chemotaxis protein